jgi:anti-sigma-K factor RskA
MAGLVYLKHALHEVALHHLLPPLRCCRATHGVVGGTALQVPQPVAHGMHLEQPLHGPAGARGAQEDQTVVVEACRIRMERQQVEQGKAQQQVLSLWVLVSTVCERV